MPNCLIDWVTSRQEEIICDKTEQALCDQYDSFKLEHYLWKNKFVQSMTHLCQPVCMYEGANITTFDLSPSFWKLLNCNSDGCSFIQYWEVLFTFTVSIDLHLTHSTCQVVDLGMYLLTILFDLKLNSNWLIYNYTGF